MTDTYEYDESILGKKDVELAMIGACFTTPELLATSLLRGEHFENPALGNLFDKMREYQAAGKGVTQMLLAEDFPDMIREIWASNDSLADNHLGEQHEAAIRDRATRRSIRSVAVRLVAIADGNERENLADRARAAVDSALRFDEAPASSMLTDVHDVLAAHRQSITLTPTPWSGLNDVIGGFGPGRLYVLGARPGVGKSALAAQAAYRLAENGPVLFATMEMDRGEVYSRIVAQQAGVYYGAMSQENRSDFIAAREEEWLTRGLRDIRVLDEGTQTVSSIRSAARTAARDGLQGVVIDYLHLLSGGEGENEVNRIARITRSLKSMAMDLQVPVIALSQLSRPTNRLVSKPGLGDLRGSGSIEQDADVVIFLYRDEEGEGVTLNNRLNVYVGKNRQGPSFVDFALDWQGDFVRAVDLNEFPRNNY